MSYLIVNENIDALTYLIKNKTKLQPNPKYEYNDHNRAQYFLSIYDRNKISEYFSNKHLNDKAFKFTSEMLNNKNNSFNVSKKINGRQGLKINNTVWYTARIVAVHSFYSGLNKLRKIDTLSCAIPIVKDNKEFYIACFIFDSDSIKKGYIVSDYSSDNKVKLIDTKIDKKDSGIFKTFRRIKI